MAEREKRSMATTMTRAIANISMPETLLPPLTRILVISGDGALQRILQRLFSSEGYEVYVVPGSLVGLSKFFQMPPTAVVLEIADTDSSDFELCELIMTLFPDMPLILLAAASEVTYRDHLLGIGGDDFLAIPFSPRELLERVRALIKDRAPVSLQDLCDSEAGCM
jgi:DNA-binding response OmpR family regulator